MSAFLAKVQPLILGNISKHLRFAKVELAPPSPGRIGGAINQFSALMGKSPANMTVGQINQNLMVAAEVCCWFIVGEIIGKSYAHGSIPLVCSNNTFYGYNVSKINAQGNRVFPNAEGQYDA